LRKAKNWELVIGRDWWWLMEICCDFSNKYQKISINLFDSFKL
jgi:hypothetical protein